MPAILLSDLLGHEVYAEQQRIGYVSDVRFVLRDDTTTGGFARAERADVYGLVVSRTRRVSHLGFERSQVNSPWLIARLDDVCTEGRF